MPDQSIAGLQEALRRFADERDWDQFHSPKNLAIALSVEAGELLEIFQWLTPEESVEVVRDDARATHVREELADVFGYLLRLADELGVDLADALHQKIASNAEKYPVRLARGNARKYTDFEASERPGRLIPGEAIRKGEFRCVGACGRLLPVTKFPTESGTPGGHVRHTECRECRDAREVGKGGNGEPPPWA